MKVYLESLGCAKNQVDSEVILKRLKDKGFEHTSDVSQADLIIVNSCGFIESAKEESINTFFELKGANPDAKIILGGCLAERYCDELELVEADAIFGNRDLSKIDDVVDELFEGKRVVYRPCFSDEENTRDELLSFRGSAYLKISEGCNHWCSYCAIPIIRGELHSRRMEYIIQEARDLVKRGIKEINLVAQDLAAYGSDWDGRSHFMELLAELVKIEGDFRIRMLYIHPDAFIPELPQFVKDNPKIIPYFDIPFQHSHPKILSRMGRTGNSEKYLKLIGDIRAVLPDAAIRTTIMLGFPGEDQETFDDVYEFVKKARFDWMGSFIYSREEDTRAYDMVDEVQHEKDVKFASRVQKKLNRLQEKITSENLERFRGNVYDVLIEEKIEGEDLSIGRIYSQAPDVDGATVVVAPDLYPGTVVRAGITGVNGVDLEAYISNEQ